jgi:hypothetical protein
MPTDRHKKVESTSFSTAVSEEKEMEKNQTMKNLKYTLIINIHLYINGLLQTDMVLYFQKFKKWKRIIRSNV